MGQTGSDGDGRALWRVVFDAVERPLTRTSQAAVQGDLFMDGLALAWRSGRRADRELRRALELGAGALRLATRGDVDRVSGELAQMHRELRAMRRELRDDAGDVQPVRGGRR